MKVVFCSIAVSLTLCGLASSSAKASDTHWLYTAFTCIHKYEGAWNANTGNGYYGGLQMDYSFMKAYGSEYLRIFGTADKWPPSLQIAVAIKAWSSRGFGPWPNTRRMCRL